VTDAPTDGEGNGTWDRLRRRKVVQWGIAYAAGAWGLLQGFAYMRDTFGWPHQIQQTATVLLLIGLPIALTLAWYHGDRGEQRVTRVELTILTLLFLLGGGLFWRYEHAAVLSSATAPPPPASGPAQGATPAAAPAREIPEKSVAVLPFLDMSENRDQEYFSDGLTEEIIDRLAKVPDLRVPARTSSFYFKGKQVTVAEIGRMLGVAHILEGSVRRSRKQLRVAVELVRVDTGYHVWSETFDRNLTDLFKTQDEIAAAVTNALTGKLQPATTNAVTQTHVDAYTLLWHGRSLADRGNKADNDKAKEFYKRALAIEPDYALAKAWLAGAYQNDVVNDWAPKKESCEAARPLGESALEMAPDLAEAHITRGNYFFNCTDDWAQADEQFARAVALEPHSARALRYRGGFLSSVLGRNAEAARLLEEAVERDPLSFAARASLSNSLAALGRLDDAERVARLALSLEPERPRFHAALGRIALQRGRPQSSLSECEVEPDPEFRLSCLAEARFALGQVAESDAALAELTAKFANDDATAIAEVYAYRGETGHALEWLARAREQDESWVGSWIGDPFMLRLKDYRRYEAFIRERWKIPPAPAQADARVAH